MRNSLQRLLPIMMALVLPGFIHAEQELIPGSLITISQAGLTRGVVLQTGSIVALKSKSAATNGLYLRVNPDGRITLRSKQDEACQFSVVQRFKSATSGSSYYGFKSLQNGKYLARAPEWGSRGVGAVATTTGSPEREWSIEDDGKFFY